MGVAITVTSAAANNVNLVDIGTDADTDGFVDGISVAINSTGFKGFFPCNGVLGMSGGTTTAATETADEVEVVISGTAGAGPRMWPGRARAFSRYTRGGHRAVGFQRQRSYCHDASRHERGDGCADRLACVVPNTVPNWLQTGRAHGSARAAAL